ncbi:Biopolymer transport protein [Desulfosarcina cetonica]|uniref:ExbD/TolR family protein n=1 Tax=Desulfosarcina cetonica TaxID=90730 RepID=UPI0006CF8EAE|nr:biopolymer transporter ExbD [Desulfosarcina cetonica]VTR67188.1 Biopolymer transport protein [Desulfosarcina cetonica]
MLNISAARRRNRATTELNIAPLIDMVFILLIFFLVNTSFTKETGIDVNRPTAATAAVKNKATILIAIDSANRVFMDHREIDPRAVRANVERALAENPEGAVVVVADKASSTGAAIQVMDGCRIAGAQQVSLAASVPQGE